MLLEKAHSLNLYKSQAITHCDGNQMNTRSSGEGQLVVQDQRNSVLCPSACTGPQSSTVCLTHRAREGALQPHLSDTINHGTFS